MKDYVHKGNDSIALLLQFNILRNEYNNKINRLNKLRRENMNFKNEYYVNKEVRAREIKTLEKELFHGR